MAKVDTTIYCEKDLDNGEGNLTIISDSRAPDKVSVAITEAGITTEVYIDRWTLIRALEVEA